MFIEVCLKYGGCDYGIKIIKRMNGERLGAFQIVAYKVSQADTF
jgi:hypothetical protein